MENYVCRIANESDMDKKWNFEIERASEEEKWNWYLWKEIHIDNFKKGWIIPYYGYLDDKIICECTAALRKEVVQNNEGLINDDTAYLLAFRTVDEYQGKGYFRELFKYMINDLKNKGYKYATLGVEPSETKNKEIYTRYGFTEYIKESYEEYPDGTKSLVEYYRKTL